MDYLYYIQINAICLAVLAIVSAQMHGKREYSPARRRAFLAIVGTTALICISDITSWLFDGRPGNSYYFVIMISNIIYDASITALGFLWLNYVRLRLGGIEQYSRRFKLLSSIPLIIMIALLISTPFNNLMFSIDQNNSYLRGDGIILHWIISWGYLFLASGLVIRRYFTTESVIEKRQMVPLMWFIIPPIIAAVLQMLFFGITIMQCGITLSIVIIAMSTLQDKIYSDPLTETNNRNAFDNYISERTNHTSARFTLLMCDVDRFKTINDTLGHVVGDIVLKRMALILKNVCGESSSRLFLCRYGGDEFIICSTDADDAEIERIKTSIAEKLKVLNKDYPLKIDLSLSIGSAQGVCSNSRDIETLIHQADEQMYSEKRAKAAESR